MKLLELCGVCTVLGATSIGLLGCASSYRVLRDRPDGGILAIDSDTSANRRAAREYMKARCPDGYTVSEEGVALVGNEATANDAQRARELQHRGYDIAPGRSAVYHPSTPVPKRTTHLVYECKSPAAPAAP